MSPDTTTDDAERAADEPLDADVHASLQSFPTLASPGSEVPAEVVVSNLAWDTIFDNFVHARDGYIDPPSTVRSAVEAEVENAGYELLGIAGFGLDVDTSDTVHELSLDVVLTGRGDLEPEATRDV